MKNILFALIALVTVLLGCSKEENVCTEVTEQLFDGNWLDNCNECKDIVQRTYDFNFTTRDSFLLHKKLINDMMYTECGSNYEWDIYVKGEWFFTHNKLKLKGIYCDENYNKLQNSACEHYIDTGEFLMEFNKFSFCNDTLILQDTTVNSWLGTISLRKSK